MDCLNLSSRPGRNLFCTVFHVDSESGLHFDLGGRISEHKSNYQLEVAMKRFDFFQALENSISIFFLCFSLRPYFLYNIYNLAKSMKLAKTN